MSMRSCETSSSYVYLFLGKSVSCLGAKVWCVCALLAFSFLLTGFCCCPCLLMEPSLSLYSCVPVGWVHVWILCVAL